MTKIKITVRYVRCDISILLFAQNIDISIDRLLTHSEGASSN